MDEHNFNSYENGSTEPPKNRGRIIAIVLCACIVLGGIMSVTGGWEYLAKRFSSRHGDIIFSVIPGIDKEDSPLASGPVTNAPAPHPDNQMQVQLQPMPEQVDNVPQAGGLGLQEIYEKNIPSVVSISCTLTSGSTSGTGVVLSKTGYIVTNAHVVEGAAQIEVLLTDGRTFPAYVVGADSFSDLAVLYIQAEDLIPAEFGDSSQARVGDAVVAIGDPLGVSLRGTMTDGIVSAINRDLVTEGRTLTLIQTNAALNAGNSGGPLINCHGQVIGINTLKITAFSDSNVEGLGFAIPSTMVKEIVDQLIAHGYVTGRPTLNISGQWVSSFQQQFRGLPAGLYVTKAPDNSGIQPQDIVTHVDGVRVTNQDELNSVLYAHKSGDQVTLTLYRNGKEHSVTVTLIASGGKS